MKKNPFFQDDPFFRWLTIITLTAIALFIIAMLVDPETFINTEISIDLLD